MKLRPVKPIEKRMVLETKETPKKETTKKKKTENKLPPDEYKPMLPPKRMLVRETPSNKDATKMVKQYLEISVKRFGEDDENQPMVYIQMYQESDFYTGYLKGKSVHLPIEMLYDLIDSLSDLSDECDEKNIF